MEKSKIVEQILAHVEQLLGLQRELDEYRRFCGELVIILSKPDENHTFLKSDFPGADFIREQVWMLIKENKELKAKLDLAGIEFVRIDGEEWQEAKERPYARWKKDFDSEIREFKASMDALAQLYLQDKEA